MKNKSVKIAACVLVTTVAISNTTLSIQATGLPAAGAAVVLNEGSTVEEVEKEVAAKEAEHEQALEYVELSVGATASAKDVVAGDVSAIVAAEAEEDYSNLVIAQVNDYVNVRSEASEESEIVGKLYNESVGNFVSEAEGGWYLIESGNVKGYVKAEYVVTGDEAVELAGKVGKRMATVNTTTLFVREEATTESSVIGMVPIEDELIVTEEGAMDGWVKVSVEEGDGYVSNEFVTLSTEFVKAESKAEEEARLAKEEEARERANAAAAKKEGSSSKSSKKSSGGGAAVGGSGRGSAVANFACQFVGNPYVYGGSSLTNGTDCSGFVMSVYANFGVGLPHSSGALRGVGADVGGLANAQPGDIVCYSGHVGIYIGGGNIVHASTAATGIKISNASYKPVLSVRRIF
ncbi:MAG: SH3 domain-containing protein [Roseburia sp.]|nr:SH3 domain-containing protein [Roseburia sp.]MCM1277738.1 SH3 domain-containing protein [Robinsoniella sp.]